MNSVSFLYKSSVFWGRKAPEEGFLAGYAAIIHVLNLSVPIPETISLISTRTRKYQISGWKIFTPSYMPEDNLYRQLVFALKYEGINLLIFKKLFEKLNENDVIELIVSTEFTGQYSRKIWFLHEWLFQKQLNIPDASVKIKYTPLLDSDLQFASEGIPSARHRIKNNLPGTSDFCPLIYKTTELLKYVNSGLDTKNDEYLTNIRKDILQRASAFLLLKDSKASFTIEGESPKSKRAARWGKAIGQAGTKELSNEEFYRLQQLVIENTRFLEMGYRQKGGFVGIHDRNTAEPIPDHISAKHQDIEQLMNGLISTGNLLLKDSFDAVLAAAVIAFGFVYIHPFEDGNGRIHRYLIHHILAKKRFSQQGIIFPVSASILNHIDDYRIVLESYASALLDFIEWKETENHNIEVTNDTIDYYRYFDATRQAEFLYRCVVDTIDNIIPEEINFLIKFDSFKKYLDNTFEFPDKLVELLVMFLQQNQGKMSKRAKENEFAALSETEISAIEKTYNEIFKT